MGGFVESVRNGWLDDFGSTTQYLALFVGDPTGAGVEISGSNYARKEVAPTDWNAAASGAKDNGNAITFPQATDVWSASNITHFGLFDASTGGNLKAYDELPENQKQPIAANNTIEFSAGDIVLTASNQV